MFQVEKGKEEENQVVRGTINCLTKGLYPIVWHVSLRQGDISSQQQTGSQADSFRTRLLWTHTHGLKYRNVECGTKVSSMCLLTPDLCFRSC